MLLSAPSRSFWTGTVGLILVGSLTGCGAQQPRVEVNDAVTDFLVEARTGSAEPYELADATAWEWDAVSVFDVGTTAAKVLEASGYAIRDEYVLQNSLLVFELDGEAVRAVNVREKAVQGSTAAPTVDYPARMTRENTPDGGVWFTESLAQ
jgi:hypothetical protein